MSHSKAYSLFSILPSHLLAHIFSHSSFSPVSLLSLLSASEPCPALNSLLINPLSYAARSHLLRLPLGRKILNTFEQTETPTPILSFLSLLPSTLPSSTNTILLSCGRNDRGQGARRFSSDSNLLLPTNRLADKNGLYIGPPEPPLFVAAGGNHSACVTISGQLQMVGANDCGQLGVGDRTGRNMWTRVADIGGRVCQVACGGSHTMVLDDKGTVWMAGANENGQLGIPEKGNELKFKKTSQIGAVTMVAAGRAHSIVLTRDGKAWGVGANDKGEIGGKWGGGGHMWRLFDTGGRKVVRIAAGGRTTMLLTADNMVLVTGKRRDGLSVIGGLGQCQITHFCVGEKVALARGIGGEVGISFNKRRFQGIEVGAGRGASCVSMGGEHYGVVEGDGGLWGGGGNGFGQVGAGPWGLEIGAGLVRACRVEWERVNVPEGRRVVGWVGGSFHTLVVVEEA